MAIQKLSVYDKRVHQIADAYIRRGYQVIIEPSAKQLPEFLQNFRPDIVAEGPDESVVIELRTRRKVRRTDYWAELAETIQRHPGWRFELVMDANLDREKPSTISREEINSRLKKGKELNRSNLQDASLLITWSAVEAAMRLASDKNGIEPPDYRPATLISTLYMEGTIGREDYDVLMHCMQTRNNIAHGIREDTTDYQCIEQLQHIALYLLK